MDTNLWFCTFLSTSPILSIGSTPMASATSNCRKLLSLKHSLYDHTLRDEILFLLDVSVPFVSRYAITAGEGDVCISFDPNYRPLLWSDAEEAKAAIWYGIGQCDILKISDDEIEFLTGEKDIDKGVEIIKKSSGAKVICATLGKEGSVVFYDDLRVFCEPFIQNNTVETTGAGDTFMGCMLSGLLDCGIDSLTQEQLHNMLVTANAAAAAITTKKGALRVMPTIEEIELIIKKSSFSLH